MKAGVLELPDIFAVNKADLGAMADRTATELEAGIGLGEETTAGWRRPVLKISAQEGTGLDALETALADHRAWLVDSHELLQRRRRSRDRAIEETLLLRYGTHGLATLGAAGSLGERLASEREASAASLLSTLSAEIERSLSTQGKP